MSAAWTCEQVQENAAELALGLTVGPRADALAHLERCDACRVLVGDLTRVVDHLLVTGPVEEPPPGFEVRVLERLAGTPAATGGAVPLAATPPRRRHRPRRATPDRSPAAPAPHRPARGAGGSRGARPGGCGAAGPRPPAHDLERGRP